MLDKILSLLQDGPKAPPAATVASGDAKQVAAAALMVEAARLDRDFDDGERATITRVVKEQFGLTDDAANDLVDVAEKRQKANYSDMAFINIVANSFDEGEKKDLLRMLWSVALSDGSLHKFEEHLVNHVASQLGLSAADTAAAKEAAKG
ncbi:TerB family tellurite resistance protein [Parvibaculaceae bacterium PLY_AMNH_Bact1]|nr:TerB family tellurite resistance protein [Parvibaculaceae bacterium PLY_AMNH_Bact1]